MNGRLYGKRLLAAAVAMAVLRVSTAGAAIELTGLVELGGLRAACVRLDSGTPTVLHLGESAAGMKLVALDVRAGWACFQLETNTVTVRLAQFCSSSTPTPAAAQASSPAPSGVSGAAQTGEQAQDAGAAALAWAARSGFDRERPRGERRAAPAGSLPHPVQGAGPAISDPAQPNGSAWRSAEAGDKIRSLFGSEAFLAWQRESRLSASP